MSENSESEYDDILQEHSEMFNRKDAEEITNLVEEYYSEKSRIAIRELWGLLEEMEGKETARAFFDIVLLYGRAMDREREKERSEASAIGCALYSALTDKEVEETVSYIR